MLYGIDFGTSNTVVSFGDGNGTKLLQFGDSVMIPSVMYVDRQRKLSVGNVAIGDYSSALQSHKNAPESYYLFRYFQGLKIALRDEAFEQTVLFGRRTRVEELIGMFLRCVREEAEQATGTPSDEVVFGWPADLDKEAEGLLMSRFTKACEHAGYASVHFVYEPVAALIDSIHEMNGTCMIFDFGGGTLDLTIADVAAGEVAVRSIVGQRLGGCTLSEDITRARIIRHFGHGSKFQGQSGRELTMPIGITSQVASFYALPLDTIAKMRQDILRLTNLAFDKQALQALYVFINRGLFQALYREIDLAKIELSSNPSATIRFAVEPHLSFAEEIRRDEFESIIQPRLEEMTALIERALTEAHASAQDIDYLFMVGGSSQIPAVRSLLERTFPGKVQDGDFFSSIASGLIKAYEMGFEIEH